MSTPTPLSPAAQAVLDAYANASDGEYVEGVWVVNERTMLAAALRAAAEQECRPSDWEPPLGVEDPGAYELGYASAVEEIKGRFHYIAAELVNTTGTDFLAVLDRARTALAEPEPEGPTDEEVDVWADKNGFVQGHGDHPCGFWVKDDDLGKIVRAALALWGS